MPSDDMPQQLATLTWLVHRKPIEVDVFSPQLLNGTVANGVWFGHQSTLAFRATPMVALGIAVDSGHLPRPEQRLAELDEWLPKAAVVAGLDVLLGRNTPDPTGRVLVQPAWPLVDPQKRDPAFFRRRCRYDVLRVVYEHLNAPVPARAISAHEILHLSRLTRLYSVDEVAEAMMYWCNKRAFLTNPSFNNDFCINSDLDEDIASEVGKFDWEEERLPQTSAKIGRQYDVFICHASEDKGFVRPLADALGAEGLAVWYDELQLMPGDSLRRSIDRGLAASRFGIVVLSQSFFAKEWPQKELDGLVQKEVGGEKVILPLWHRVSREEVARHSLTLADKVAIPTDGPLTEIVGRLLQVVRPKR